MWPALVNGKDRDPANAGPLSGVRVLELGHQIAGPYCARLLADQGADVIKVERPRTGDIARAMQPFAGEAGIERSLTYLYLNYNKRGVTLDFKRKAGREILLELVRDADIVIENFRPQHLQSFGLGFEDLAAANPDIIVTSITNFGQTGPRAHWRGNDLINYAVSGAMSISGTSDREPIKHGNFQSAYMGGLNAVMPTMGALLMRDSCARSQHVDVSIAEALTSTLVFTVPYYTYMGETQSRRAPIGETFGNCTPAKDGWVIAHAPRSGNWKEFCEMLDEPLLDDQRFATVDGRLEHAEDLDRILGNTLRKQNRFDVFRRANDLKILFGVVQTPADLVHCEQLLSRGFFHEIDHPVVGKLLYAGEAFHTSQPGFAIRMRPPLLGEHNAEVYGALGHSAGELETLQKTGVI